MKLRGLLLIMLGVLAVVLALAVFIRGGVSTICPAVGYACTGDVELVFVHEPRSVSACFGEGCTPALVTKSRDGRWLVPQSAPYLVPRLSRWVVVSTVVLGAVASVIGFVLFLLPSGSARYGWFAYAPLSNTTFLPAGVWLTPQDQAGAVLLIIGLVLLAFGAGGCSVDARPQTGVDFPVRPVRAPEIW